MAARRVGEDRKPPGIIRDNVEIDTLLAGKTLDRPETKNRSNREIGGTTSPEGTHSHALPDGKDAADAARSDLPEARGEDTGE